MFFKRQTSGISSLSDSELLDKYRKTGDGTFFGELFKRYTHLVYGVCLKYLRDPDESSDAVMQIFEKLLGDLKKHEVSNFKSWLYSVAKNHCLMKLRKEPLMLRLEEEQEIIMESGEEMHLLNEKELQLVKLEKAMECLNTQQRKCVELFYIKEKSYKEITEETGYSIKEVKSYLQNAKRNLKNFMNGNER
jgi:RNA polymerase sigma factor (sigma-70 family)